jgi:formate hydrogenlyase transcriptional activator
LEAACWMIGGAEGAAAKLGLKRTTLFYKMKKLGISRPSPSRRVKVPVAAFESAESPSILQ